MSNWQAQTVRYALYSAAVADVSSLLMDKLSFPHAPVHAVHKALIPAWVWERGLGNAACDLGVLTPSLSRPYHIN